MARITRVKPRFWLILMALMLSAFFALYTTQEDVIARQAEQIAELQGKKDDLEVRIAADTRKLEFSKSDEYIERVARSMGMVMPGEVLYVEPKSE